MESDYSYSDDDSFDYPHFYHPPSSHPMVSKNPQGPINPPPSKPNVECKLITLNNRYKQ